MKSSRYKGQILIEKFKREMNDVKTIRSELSFFLFSLYILFYFQFIFLYSIFRTRVRVRMTRSC